MPDDDPNLDESPKPARIVHPLPYEPPARRHARIDFALLAGGAVFGFIGTAAFGGFCVAITFDPGNVFVVGFCIAIYALATILVFVKIVRILRQVPQSRSDSLDLGLMIGVAAMLLLFEGIGAVGLVMR